MSEFKRIPLQKAHQQWAAGSAKVADIRDPQAFAMGHIPGAFHLTDATLNDFLQQVDEDDAVLVVCYHGISSQGAAQYLLQQGLTNVASMDGGFTAWAHEFPDAIEHS